MVRIGSNRFVKKEEFCLSLRLYPAGEDYVSAECRRVEGSQVIGRKYQVESGCQTRRFHR